MHWYKNICNKYLLQIFLSEFLKVIIVIIIIITHQIVIFTQQQDIYSGSIENTIGYKILYSTTHKESTNMRETHTDQVNQNLYDFNTNR